MWLSGVACLVEARKQKESCREKLGSKDTPHGNALVVTYFLLTGPQLLKLLLPPFKIAHYEFIGQWIH